MPRSYLWSQSVPRVELDQRSRESRLQFERKRLLIPRATVMRSWLRRLLYLFTIGRYGGLPQSGGPKELLGDQWPYRCFSGSGLGPARLRPALLDDRRAN